MSFTAAKMEPELSTILATTQINQDGQESEKETLASLSDLIDFLKDKMTPSVGLNE